MIRNDDEWLALIDAFHDAAIDGTCWYPALEALAAATGSRSGQLIGLGADAAVPFNMVTNLDYAALKAWHDCGGSDPETSPRVKAAMNARILQVVAEEDFLSAAEHERHPHYEEFARPWDIPFGCLAPLERRDGLLLGLAVLRSQKEGPISAEQRRLFSAVAPHVRAAVRTQLALESHGAAMLAGCMDALSVPLFVCDESGCVRALTLGAEELVRGATGLQLKAGRLLASDPGQTARLTDAIAAAASGHHPAASAANLTVVVRSAEEDAAPVVLDIVALPSLQYEFNFTPRVLVMVRGAREADERRASILRVAYDLTAAETEIALRLSEGKSPDAIATARGVAIGTVRTQIKTLLAKVGTNRQPELVARLNQF